MSRPKEVTRYDRAFRNRIKWFFIFFLAFLLGLYGWLLQPDFWLVPPPFSHGYILAPISALVMVAILIQLMQMRQLHEKFKNTGYDWPYPKDVEP